MFNSAGDTGTLDETPKGGWRRIHTFTLVLVVAILLVAGDVGYHLTSKTLPEKVQAAVAVRVVNHKNLCTSLVPLTNASGATPTSDTLLSALEGVAIAVPQDNLHVAFGDLAVDYAELFGDRTGLAAATKGATTGGTITDLSDPKVKTFSDALYYVAEAKGTSGELASIIKSCGISIARTSANASSAVALVEDVYYNAVASNGPWPVTAAEVKAVPSTITALVVNSTSAAGAPDLQFTFASGPAVCVSDPQNAGSPAPTVVPC